MGRVEAGEADEEAAGLDDLGARRYDSGVIAAILLSFLAQDRSLYVWTGAIADGKPEAGTKLLAFCAEKKVTRLYLMVAWKQTDPLRAFVRSAHAAKVQVHAMHPGDMSEWLDAFPEKFDHKVIVDWVEGVVKEGIYDGVHLDIEPHSRKEWKADRLRLAAGYLELLKLCKGAAGKLPLSAAVPDNWHREDLKVGGRVLIEGVQDVVDWISVMSYHGKNAARVLESIASEWAYKPGRVELIQETDPTAVEEGVPLHVGSNERLEEIFKAATEKYGRDLRLAVHHYATWRDLR
jgi:phage gp46-like protein